MLAIILLPRQFKMVVVEHVNEQYVNKAIWLFSLYLSAINIFVLPIAFGGLLHFPDKTVYPDTLFTEYAQPRSINWDTQRSADTELVNFAERHLWPEPLARLRRGPWLLL